MPIENHGHEYEFEPQYGLPERLPQDEHIIWQGSPAVGALAISAFHLRKLAFYFALLILACAWPALEAFAGIMAVVLAVKWIVPITVIGLGSVWILAWMTARTTVYTLTNRRMVMRLGIVLTVSFNFPLKRITAADVRMGRGGFGDISLALEGDDRIAWVHLWPSVRAWRINKTEPTLRAVPEAEVVALQLRDAWTKATGLEARSDAAHTSASGRKSPSFQAYPI
jgi:Bacterial PH domain